MLEAVSIRARPSTSETLREALPRRAAPVVAVGDERHPADRRAGRALDQPQLGLRPRLGQQHEIGEGEADRLQPVARAREVGARRGDQQVDPLRLERRRAVGAVATVVGCGGQVERPARRRLLAADQGVDLAVAGREEAAEIAARELAVDVDPVGAQVEAVEVGVGDRRASGAPGRRPPSPRGRRRGPRSPRGCGGRCARHSCAGRRPRPRPRSGALRPARPAPRSRARARRARPGRPPTRDPSGRRAAPARARRGARRGPPRPRARRRRDGSARASPRARRPARRGRRCQRSRSPSTGRGARERMDRGIGERRRGRLAGAGEERGAIEPPGLALGRRPARAVGELLGEEVADRVAQRRPDPGGVGVGGQVLEVGDRDPAELLALGEDLGELPACRGGDLLAGPELQVELLVARHPLAAADLPGVGALVLGERAGEVETDRGVGARSRGPGRGGERLDRRLVAAERDAQLGAAHERARPLLVGAGGAGPFEQRLDPVGRLGELLLGDERVDRLPVGSRRGVGAAHRAGARAGERGGAERAGGGEAGEESAAEAGRAHGNLRSITGWRFPGPS